MPLTFSTNSNWQEKNKEFINDRTQNTGYEDIIEVNHVKNYWIKTKKAKMIVTVTRNKFT